MTSRRKRYMYDVTVSQHLTQSYMTDCMYMYVVVV